jgi:hypothetical protein
MWLAVEPQFDSSQLRSGGGWNYLMFELIPEPDSTDSERKKNVTCSGGIMPTGRPKGGILVFILIWIVVVALIIIIPFLATFVFVWHQNL